MLKATAPNAEPIKLEVLPDTGANVSAISEKDARGMDIFSTNKALKTADGNLLHTLGRLTAFISFKGNTAIEHVYVVRGLSRPLLSRQMLKELGLIHPDFPNQALQPTPASLAPVELPKGPEKTPEAPTSSTQKPSFPGTTKSLIVSGQGPDLDMLMNEFAELFDDQCTTMKNSTYRIELEDGAIPVSYGACRNIPEPYMPALKRELEALEAQGIIRRIEHSTPWLHPIVVVPKKGTTDIRVCVDFTRLNRFVKRPVNQQPTPWETFEICPRVHGTLQFLMPSKVITRSLWMKKASC